MLDAALYVILALWNDLISYAEKEPQLNILILQEIKNNSLALWLTNEVYFQKPIYFDTSSYRPKHR